MDEATLKNSYSILKVALVIFAFHVLGVVLPEVFWGVHYPAFLSPVSTFLVYSVALLLLVSPFLIKQEFKQTEQIKLKWILPVAGSIVIVCSFYAFPIHYDVYGDAHFLKPGLENTITEMSDTLWSYIFSFDLLDPKVGGKTTGGLIGGFSYLTGATGFEVYIVFDAVCGALFVFFWIRLVVEFLTKNSWRIVFSLIGMFAPFMLMFYGHIELYALALLGLMAYMTSALFYLRRRKRLYLWLSIILTVLAIKFHVTSFLLVPVTVFLILIGNAEKLGFVRSLMEPKSFLKKVVAPIYVFGGIAFFYHTSANGNKRSFTEDTLESALFIPFSSSEPAPLDRYNLFSSAHLSDYLNLVLLWSSAALFIIVLALTVGRKWVNWKNPIILFSALPLLIYAAAFFVLNPLLAMSIDWDLFSLPAPFLLVFALVIASHLEKEKFNRFMLGPIAGMILLSLPVITVNANQESLSNRLEAVAKWDFKTYWIGTSYLIEESIALKESDHQSHRLRILEELEPHAIKENDLEYAEVLCNAGIYYWDEKQDLDSALIYFRKAKEYEVHNIKNLFYLAQANVKAGEYEQPKEFLQIFVQQQYPTLQEALNLAVRVSVETGDYESAKGYCAQYLTKWSTDVLISKVNEVLLSEEPENARLLYSQN